jgi:hypothetical protein
MDSVEFGKALTKVGKDLMRIAEGVEAAADGDLSASERELAIQKAREKLKEYNDITAVLEKDSKVLLAQLVKQHQFHIELIKESLAKIDGT